MVCAFKDKCRKAGFHSTLSKYRDELCCGTISEIENCYIIPVIHAKLREAGVE
ncbi:MAG: hypothetical protein PHQ88_07465 [Bacteroides sp.]|nr:hypothetical protein [Bacteroides sp.]